MNVCQSSVRSSCGDRIPSRTRSRSFDRPARLKGWQGGEPVLNEELSEAHWLRPEELAGLTTTTGLAEIVESAFERLRTAR